ncbi:hypothetical protein MKEN_01101700 [Mycena kentingensis (nom. inval.)]|nr:hypothetical protein MKEN_01101700 [Mycena kentingensis (nom. inval.)]
MEIPRQLAYLVGTFLPDQWFAKIPETTEDLTGRTYIVTGANGGLGMATVIHLARMKPARIVLAVRNAAKGNKARDEIVTQTGYGGIMDVWELDMGSFASVRAFAERVDAELQRLDGVLLNAGINVPYWKHTVDGWEETLQVNLLATGLLGVLLLPILNKTTALPDSKPIAPHLTLTGSTAHCLYAFPQRKHRSGILQALNDEKQGQKKDRYPTSKLLLILYARELASLRLAANVVVSVADPGLCATNIGSEYDLPRWARSAAMSVAWPPEKGALNIIHALLQSTPPASFVSCCAVRRTTGWSYTKDGVRVQKQLWKEMVEEWCREAPVVEAICRE